MKISLKLTFHIDRENQKEPERFDEDRAMVEIANTHEPLGFTPNQVEI